MCIEYRAIEICDRYSMQEASCAETYLCYLSLLGEAQPPEEH